MDYTHEDGSKVWFTSDTHFGHEAIIRLCKRPFKNAYEMNETMVANWNRVVKPEDYVYHLGDLAFRDDNDKTTELLFRLNGKIRMVEGNHDKSAWKIYMSWTKNKPDFPLTEINRYLEIEVEKQTICLFHYAQREWHWNLRGTWHLFGHTHGHLKPYGKSFDVGVDTWNFTPISFAQVKEKMETLAIAEHARFDKYKPK